MSTLPVARPLAAIALLAAASVHAAPSAYYAATPVATPAHASLMTRDTPWRRAGATYIADRAPERAEVLCQLVAGHVGALSGFSAGGVAFDADRLALCNAKVKSAPTTSVAAR